MKKVEVAPWSEVLRLCDGLYVCYIPFVQAELLSAASCAGFGFWMTLCRFADPENGCLSLSGAALARRTKISRGSVIAKINSLVDAGYLVNKGAVNRYRGVSNNTYQITIPLKVFCSLQYMYSSRINIWAHIATEREKIT